MRPTFSTSRRDFLRAGMYAVGVSAGLPALFRDLSLVQTAKALYGLPEKHPDRILVVLELSGGNDGLNTVIPHADDAYYKVRPTIGIKKDQVLKLDDHLGLHPACSGMQSLYKDGKLAIVPGCGYPNPNLSHFTAMEWWHTAMPHGSNKYGWLGRFADAYQPTPKQNYIVNISSRQSLAVSSAKHSPVVFSDPRKFGRIGSDAQQKVFETFGKVYPTSNSSLDFVNTVSRTATGGAALVRSACAEYRTLVDYGSDNNLTLDLKKGQRHDQRRLTHAHLLLEPGWLRHSRCSGGHPAAAAYLPIRRSEGFHGRPGEDRPVGRCCGDGLYRVRPPGERERQPRHRPRHGDSDVCRRQARQGWFLRSSAKPDRPGRRQSEDEHRLPLSLRGDAQRLDGPGRHEVRPERRLPTPADLWLTEGEGITVAQIRDMLDRQMPCVNEIMRRTKPP